MSGFFEEIKRRKVYRVAVAYAVAAGGVIQIASAVFPAWELPAWSLRLVIVLLLIGFPISLILAWALEVTPEGIRPTPPPVTRRRRSIAALLASGVLVSAAAGFFLLPGVSARKIEKSIAVLPFENLSQEKENAYFADGIQDDILTNLSKIGDLKVISRTSVMSYRGKTLNVREIAKALGVSSILEGSVRREGNRVRVNVQLINANNDEHIWASNYDRDLVDVFAIQTDLAHEIAGALQAKLSPTEKAQIEHRPTENADAYLLYVQAHDLMNRPDRFRSDLTKAEQFLQEATRLDPKFALAFAGLSQLESWLYHTDDPTPARRDKARSAANEALRLQPDLPEVHLALGFSYYYGDRDYERALSELAIAQRGLPNDAETYVAIAAIERRQGKWVESTAHFEKAVSLNPKDAFTMENLAYNYIATKNYEAADKTFDRGIEVAPQSFSLRGSKAKLALDWKGDFSVIEKELAAIPPGTDADGLVNFTRVNVLMLQRKFPEALAIVQQMPGEIFHEGSTAVPKAFLEGIIASFMKDGNKAREAFQRARLPVERSIRESPDDASRHALLGAILAGLGEKEMGIAEGKRAAELLPESKDAFDGPAITVALAQIYCWTGELDDAFRLLDHSLNTPNGITVSLLKLDPVWDPVRGDPRFKALIDKYGAKT